MQLRGFDSYEVTLGDLMRGERASMGKSLIEAERDMRIKANLIEAIENCDLDAFKNKGIVSGYVRSYARYLGLDAEEAFQRFCFESGFEPPTLELYAPAPQRRRKDAPGSNPAHALSQSRFAVPPAPSRLRAAISFSGLASTCVLIALVAGLGYGGYYLLQDIQRVGFEPLPEAPVVVAEAPIIAVPEPNAAQLERPAAEAYSGDGALAAMTLPSELPLPVTPTRDTPISSIDPETAGLYGRGSVAAGLMGSTSEAPEFPVAAVPERTPLEAALAVGQLRFAIAELGSGLTPETALLGLPEIKVVARGEAWIRVRGNGNKVLFEGILKPGDSFTLPSGVEEPRLRAGNAGEVFVSIGGRLFGPVGAPGSVQRGASLLPEDVYAAWPEVAQAPAPDSEFSTIATRSTIAPEN